jgi:hypothetical protein
MAIQLTSAFEMSAELCICYSTIKLMPIEFCLLSR